jgi:hypothetical protein
MEVAMDIMYALEPMQGQVQIETGGTVLMFEPHESEIVEFVLCQLLHIVQGECRLAIQDALKHVRTTHTAREVQ